MPNKFQNVFDALPNVRTIWVDENGAHYLSPKSGCTKIDRDDSIEVEPVVEDEVKPKIKKGKK
jgi:hypothetical protein